MGSDYLLAFAEIAVAFAGFSSLVALLGPRRGESHPQLDAVRLQVMLEASLFVALMSVVPLLPGKLGASDHTTWRVSSAAFLVADGIATSVFGVVDKWVIGLIAVLSLGADLLALVILLGRVPQLSAGLYLGALIANLVISGLLFVRFADSTFRALTTD